MDEDPVPAVLRTEYAEARRDLERALDGQRAGNARLHELTGRVQALYLKIYLLEHGLTEDSA